MNSTTMNYENILTENKGNALVITINRESKLNALNTTLLQEIKHAVEQAQNNTSVKGIIITGSGPKAFAAGADISEFLSLDAAGGAELAKVYFEKIQSVLKPSGVLAIQAIVCPDSRFEAFKKNVDFIQKHIFPGSLLPSIAAINSAINETGDLFMFGLKDMGKSYVITLSEWRNRFNLNIEKVRQLGFDDEFIRKWNYYFSYCEAAFDMRNINVVQMVYTRPNNYNY